MQFKEVEAIRLYSSERKKNGLNTFTKNLFLTLSIVSFLLFLFLLLFDLFTITGFVSYIASRAGEVTGVNVHTKIPVEEWVGFYGLALTVPGFTEQLSEQIDSGTIERADVFFDCLQQDSTGGPEIYASTSSSLDFSSVIPAEISVIDSLIVCSGEVFCANETFTEQTSLMVGSTNVTGIPSTRTYRYDGNNTSFEIGAINVSGQLAFFTRVGSIQKGFNPNVTVNFQMILPSPVNTTQTYYFFNDPSDSCPAGGIGTSIEAYVEGYVFDGNTGISNASVTVAGYSSYTNDSGFYSISYEALAGTFNIIALKGGYQPSIKNVTVNFTSYNSSINFSMISSPSGVPLVLNISGTVKDSSGSALSDAIISFGNSSVSSNSEGYSMLASVVTGTNPIIAYKTGYDNYYAYVNVSSNSSISHNVTLISANTNSFPTGPYTEQRESDIEEIRELAEELGIDYWISTNDIKVQVRKNTFVEQKIKLYNFKQNSISVTLVLSDSLNGVVELDKPSVSIPPDSSAEITLTIYGTEPFGLYEGSLLINGITDVQQNIPIEIEIVDNRIPIETMFMTVEILRDTYSPGSEVKYKVGMQNLLVDESYKVALITELIDSSGKSILSLEAEEFELRNSLSILRTLDLPQDVLEGDYVLRVKARFLNIVQTVEEPFKVALPFIYYSFFGIPLWIVLVFISSLSFVSFTFLFYKHQVDKKKRYHLSLNPNLLPKDGPRSIKIGKLAETNIPAYYDLDMFTTHAIIAGATGGGKSIAAQVLIEEALMKNIAVIVFDPTAQWSGMLRKCDDKKMLSFYPKFGLKESDARAFPGNVRQIVDHRQLIDINKYVNPGQIQIFTMNKLEPSQIDTFVSGVISSIFKSDPKEHPGLKTLLVFDEVHRLLPKFGGQGKGFLQIERACREFRKWGLGVMLVSQVLSDFVGEIKANINTEIQMRVAEESDLNRIKERYGLDALKSLVRADIGVGMIQNAEYNKGLPYFVGLRPILHSTRRLSDEVLDKYNLYGETIEDLEYQIEQLEKEKVDTFDLKMELKLVKDKLMTGNFTVVDIYLEGLRPRLSKQWEKIGKKPKKKELQLISESELNSSIVAAQKERDKWNKTNDVSKDVKKESVQDIFIKIVKPITFDNGMMISSLKELKETLPNIEEQIFSSSVNKEKNQIAEWVGKEINSDLGKAMMGAYSPSDILKVIEEYQKSLKKEEKKADSS